MSKDNEINLTLRVNEVLHQQIKDAARRSERSLNREIIFRLRRTFECEPIEAVA
jgi:predicted HicB family RNase H-like nuclease